jgi:phospholipid transport system substrate-binding protein
MTVAELEQTRNHEVRCSHPPMFSMEPPRRFSMRKLSSLALVALTFLLADAARADAALDKAVEKTLKSLVGAIRYGKDDLAAKQVSFGGMAKGLVGDDWAKLSAAEQTEVVQGLEKVIRAISFPKGRDMFQYLDAMLYDKARLEGETARVKSTVVVHRDLKKAEIIIDWVLVKDGGGWKVVDTVMMGESTLTGLRDGQVKPLIQQGGTAALMKALRDKVAEVSKT